MTNIHNMKDTTSITTPSEFTINEANDRLLFDFARGVLDSGKAYEVEKLINLDKSWKEYYLDMKALYDKFGDNGIDCPSIEMDVIVKDPEYNAIYISIDFYKKQLISLWRSYKRHEHDREGTEGIILEVLEIGDLLLNIPKAETACIITRSRYCETLKIVGRILKEFQLDEIRNDRISILEDVDLTEIGVLKHNTLDTIPFNDQEN